MLGYKDGDKEVSIEMWDEVTGCWMECNQQPRQGEDAVELIDRFRRLLGSTARYRVVTHTYHFSNQE